MNLLRLVCKPKIVLLQGIMLISLHTKPKVTLIMVKSHFLNLRYLRILCNLIFIKVIIWIPVLFKIWETKCPIYLPHSRFICCLLGKYFSTFPIKKSNKKECTLDPFSIIHAAAVQHRSTLYSISYMSYSYNWLDESKLYLGVALE